MTGLYATNAKEKMSNKQMNRVTLNHDTQTWYIYLELTPGRIFLVKDLLDSVQLLYSSGILTKEDIESKLDFMQKHGIKVNYVLYENYDKDFKKSGDDDC